MIHHTAIIGAPPSMFPYTDGKRPRARYNNHGTLIAPDVHILALAIVVNGTKRPTTIKEGSRLLHRAHIGHDCIIGAHCLIGVGATLGGFVEVGDRSTVSMGALVHPEVKIGNDCLIGMGAVVVKDVPDNTTVHGSPAHHQARRNW